jgi:hypothetical protein
MGALPFSFRHKILLSSEVFTASGREKSICEDSLAPGAFLGFT